MKRNKELREIAQKLAIAGIKIGAIKIRPNDPFTWASGWKSPIYNDNRMFLYFPENRKLITQGLKLLIEHYRYFPQIIASTATAGIPHGDRLAEKLQLPEIYVRDKPKEHGMRNQIEGIAANDDLGGRRVVLIEDLISTGGSSVKAVQAIRDANGDCRLCLSIFSYGFSKAEKMFQARIPFDKESIRTLDEPCGFDSILNYSLLLETAVQQRYLNGETRSFLNEWSADPEKWSNEWKENHPEEKVV